MAKEHGMMEHKGKTIPKEVKSLADRIRKKEPDRSDEYAYRTAWDIFRSETPEGKSYPHKSPESGLAREGGGAGPLSKTSSDNFWSGFEKRAGFFGKNLKGPTLDYRGMASKAEKALKDKSKSPAVLRYQKGTPSYIPPGVSPN